MYVCICVYVCMHAVYELIHVALCCYSVGFWFFLVDVFIFLAIAVDKKGHSGGQPGTNWMNKQVYISLLHCWELMRINDDDAVIVERRLD